MLRSRIFIITTHIAGWLLFIAFPLFFLNGGGETNVLNNLSHLSYWIYCATYIALFYINAYLLIPLFFLRKKYVDYAIAVFVLLSCVYYIKPYDKLLHNGFRPDNFTYYHGQFPHNGPPNGMMPPAGHNQPGQQHNEMPPGGQSPQGPPPGNMQPPQSGDSAHQAQPPFMYPAPGNHIPHHNLDSTSLFIFLMIMAISAAVKIVQQWQLTERRAAQAEADKASAELSFLKAQINPHFLFNTLNNIYTLAVIKDDNTANSIMKLSNIMRYVTDDVITDMVPLHSEIDCISDFIELQRLRLNDKTTINFSVSGKTDGRRIAPLVLMTFVENIFKYGISKHEPSVIAIDIAINENNIAFFCENTIFENKSDSSRTGIGITNTRRRLEHLYPGRHVLTISQDNRLYTVQLTLKDDEA